MIQHLKLVWQFRYFWASLVQLDFRKRYRRSVLGVGWSMLQPLAMTAVLCIAFGTMLNMGNVSTYAPYLLGGLAVWSFMKESLSFGCEAFTVGEAYIRQSPLPYSIYPLRAVLGTFVHFLISLSLVVLSVLVLQGNTDVFSRLLGVLPAVVLLTIFCWSLATIAAFANAYFHDTKHLIEIFTQLLFFLTPIMYRANTVVEKVGPWMIELNPAAQFIMLIGHPLADGPPTADELRALYASAGSLTVVMFGLACCTMAWLQKRLIFQL